MSAPRSFWLRVAPAVALVLVASVGTGCKFLKKNSAEEDAAVAEAPSVEPSATAPAEEADAATAEPTEPVDVDRIPWHGGEQSKATKEITPSNYKSELDKLTQEINTAK